MNPLLTFRVTLRALLRNKMWSFLSMLESIIGVSAVIAIIAIEGAEAQVDKQFAAMGTSLFVIMPGSRAPEGHAADSARSRPSHRTTFVRFESEVPLVKRLGAPPDVLVGTIEHRAARHLTDRSAGISGSL
jgi:hypothetical protein